MRYKDKEWLSVEYEKRKRTIYDIASELQCSPRTVHSWLCKHGIDRRPGGVKYWSETHKQRLREWNLAHPEVTRMKGKRHSEETKRKMSEARTGEGGSNWKGGITVVVRGFRWSAAYQQWRRSVLARDRRTCRKCGRHATVVHYIVSMKDDPSLRLEIANGITVCTSCHKSLHSGRKTHE